MIAAGHVDGRAVFQGGHAVVLVVGNTGLPGQQLVVAVCILFADGVLNGVIQVGDLYPVVTDFRLFAEDVEAIVRAIYIEVHKTPLAGEIQFQLLSQIQRHGVADQGQIGGAGQQHPFLGLAHTHHIGLFLQLDLEALLGAPPAGVAPALDLHLHLGQGIVAQQHSGPGGFGIMLAVRLHLGHRLFRVRGDA